MNRGGARHPSDRADAGAVSRVPPRTRSGVLGVRVSGDHDLRARHRVPIARRGAGDRRRGRAGRRGRGRDRAREARRIHRAAHRAGRGRSRGARRPRAGGGGARLAADLSLRPGARGEPGGAAGGGCGAAARRGAGRCVRAGGAAGDECRLALHRLARAGTARHEHHEHRAVGRRVFDRAGAHARSCSSGWWRRRCRRRIT